MAKKLVTGLIYFPEDAFEMFKGALHESGEGRTPVGLLITRNPEEVSRDRGLEASRFIDPGGRTLGDVIKEAGGSKAGVPRIILMDISTFGDEFKRAPDDFMDALVGWLNPDEVLLLHWDNPGLLEKVKENYVGHYSMRFFEVLANPIRRGVMERLHQWGVGSFARLLEELDVKPTSKLSYHIKELKEEGMVRQDTKMLYSLTGKGVMAAGFIGKIKDGFLDEMNATFR